MRHVPLQLPARLIVEPGSFYRAPGVPSTDPTRMSASLPVPTLERRGAGRAGFFIGHAASVFFWAVFVTPKHP